MKKENNQGLIPLKSFVAGMACYSVILPVTESLVALTQAAFNRVIAKWQFDLNEAAAESEAAVEVIKPAEYTNTQAIGFQIPSESDYYEE